jgi:hypothetical protein
MSYTFFELQKEKKYKIVIPQIQRDYAQGREDKNNDNKIKGYDFILKIIEVLTNDNSKLHLDFVYGFTEEIDKNQFAFIPLDGQQRLTTLWLLHWYLSPKNETEQNGIKMISISDEVKEWLKNFTYITRDSSKRFCEELIEKYLPVSDNIYMTIKDAVWFMASWQNDPTVVSMLNMLDTLQKLNFDKEKAWENLFKNRKITFDYIDIKSDEFKLTDELYIKMNSRGKLLTSFENLKAQLSEIISDEDTDKLDYEETKVTFQKYFAFKIDSVWTDLFWHFVSVKKEKIQEAMKNSRNLSKDESPISYCFMNFFTYIAQMCYFRDNLDMNADDFKKEYSIFKNKENTRFLFNTLNLFYGISTGKSNQVNIDNINTFFKKIFHEGNIDTSYQGQVRIFEDNDVNLFEKCLLEGDRFSVRNRIILYCLISYTINYGLNEVNYELRYYIRVIRNLLQAKRYINGITYVTDFRINSFGNYWKLFNQLQEKPNAYRRLLEYIDNKGTEISDNALNNEKEKAKIVVDNISTDQAGIQALFQLEEFDYFKGLIHQLKPKETASKFTYYSKAVREIWGENKDDLVIAALIACDFDGLHIRYCNAYQWKTITFGKHNTVLTSEDDKISNSILKLIDAYLSLTNGSSREKLEQIVSSKLEILTVRDWRYYFLKYYNTMFKNGNYFAWGNDFEIESLGSESFNPLVAYHINPYVTTVSHSLSNMICNEINCWGIYSYESKIALKNRFELYCKKDGWYIKVPEDQTIPDELRKKYDIKENNIFSETDGKDRIEIAVEFCKDLTL